MDYIEVTAIVVVVVVAAAELRIVKNSIATPPQVHLLIVSNKGCYCSSFIRNITTVAVAISHFQLLHCFG